MTLLRLIVQLRPGVFALSLLSGAAAGIGTTGLLALTVNFISRHSIPETVPVFLGVGLIVLLSGIASQTILVRLTQDIVRDLRLMLARQIVSSELSHLEQQRPARLLSMLTDDVATVAYAMQGIPVFYINLAVIAACLVYLAWQSLPMFSVVLVFVGLGVGIYSGITWRALRFLERARDGQDQLFLALDGLIHGIKELKLDSVRCGHFFDQELAPSATTYRNANVAALTGYSVAANFGRLMFFLTIAILVLYSSHFGDARALSAYGLVLLFLVSPFDAVLSWLPVITRANVAMQRVHSFGMSLAQQHESAGSPYPIVKTLRTIELRDVAHSYGESAGAAFHVGPLNLVVHSGEATFLIGGNGAGKSTFAKLFAGLYPPRGGEIVLDGIPITAENRGWYRSHFAAIFADSHVFCDFSHIHGADVEHRAQRYLERLQLHSKVDLAGRRFSSVDLSQGQRKRLALLVTLLEDKPVYVFDEWASDQDPISKEWFYKTLIPELKGHGKLVFVITHDQRYFDYADRLVVLDEGRVVKEAKHHRSPSCDR